MPAQRSKARRNPRSESKPRPDDDPDASLLELYRSIYLSVAGSHVTAYNGAHFGPLETLGAGEFLQAP